MPRRIARSSVSIDAPKIARKKNRKRNLDAYAIASHSLPETTGIKPSRLGEYRDDAPKQKRRRAAVTTTGAFGVCEVLLNDSSSSPNCACLLGDKLRSDLIVAVVLPRGRRGVP